MKIIEKLSAPLSPADIELRIGRNVIENRGFPLFPYKTARTDINRLNEVCGLNWKNRFFYDDKGLLCCEISVLNTETNEWISRVDVGTESREEKEKGNYSDARKRAGTTFGIGIELYSFPFIWISTNEWKKNKHGKTVPKDNPSNWSVRYVGKDYKSGILIYDERGNLRWSSKKQVAPLIKPQQEKKHPPKSTPKPPTQEKKQPPVPDVEIEVPEVPPQVEKIRMNIEKGFALLEMDYLEQTRILRKYGGDDLLSRIEDLTKLKIIYAYLVEIYKEKKFK